MVVSDRGEVAWWASVYQLTRIAAFIDPLFNPVLVAVRTPIIRRRVRIPDGLGSQFLLKLCLLLAKIYGFLHLWCFSCFPNFDPPNVSDQLRYHLCITIGFLCALFCPWWRRPSFSFHRRHHRDSMVVTMKTWAERKRSFGANSRRGSSSSCPSSNESGNPLTLRAFCSRQVNSSIIWI